MCRIFSHWFASETHETRKARVFFPIFHDVFICFPWFSIAGWWSSLILFGIPGRPFFDIWISERPFVNVYEWIDGGCFTNHNFSIFTYTFTICLGYLEGQKVIVFSTFHVMCSGSMMYAIWNQPPSWVNLWVLFFIAIYGMLEQQRTWNTKHVEHPRFSRIVLPLVSAHFKKGMSYDVISVPDIHVLPILGDLLAFTPWC